MEKAVRVFLIFCLLPFILLLVQVGLGFVPVQESVTYDGNTVHIHFGNWITDLGLDFWLEFIFYSAISFQGVFAIILLLQSQREGEAIIMPKKHRDTPMIFAMAFIGIMLFLFGTQLAVYTNTNLNYSALGGFIFLAGLVMYVATKRRR